MKSNFLKSSITEPSILDMMMTMAKKKGSKKDIENIQRLTVISLVERITSFFEGYNEHTLPCLIAACEIVAGELRCSFKNVGDEKNNEAANKKADELKDQFKQHSTTITVKNPFTRKE